MPIPNLKNYATEVPAIKSIDMIEKLLVDFGATRVSRDYGEVPGLPGMVVTQISFMMKIDKDNTLPFVLSANIDKVLKWLRKNKPSMQPKKAAEQSNRIAWKRQYEIIFLQLGNIEMDMAEKLETFFPMLYNISTHKTFYQQTKEGGFKNLLPSTN